MASKTSVRVNAINGSEFFGTGRNGFSVRNVSVCFLGAVAVALMADLPESLGAIHVASRLLLYALLIALMALPLPHALLFLMMSSIVCQDITQAQSESVEYGASLGASMWQGGLGPLRPGWFMIAFCLILLVKSRVYVRDRPVQYAVLWYASVPILAGWAYGGFATDVAPFEVPIDVKLPMFLITSILLYRSYLKERPQLLGLFAAAFVAAVLARHSVDFVYWLAGVGPLFDGANRVSVDSTKGTVVFLLLFGTVLMVRHGRLIMGGALGVASAMLLVVYVTRGLWVSAVLGMCVLLLLVRTRHLMVAFPLVIVLACGSYYTIKAISPENVHLAQKRVDSFGVADRGNFLEGIEPNRYAEMVNAADATLKRGAILWGSGYGGFYTESSRPFPARMKDAFPDYSMTSGRFYTLHHFVLRALFEHGLIGFLIISSLWAIPGWRCFKTFRNPPPGVFFSFVVALVAFLPTSMLEMSWTGKGMIIGGFVLAWCMCVYDAYRPAGPASPPTAPLGEPRVANLPSSGDRESSAEALS